MMDLCDSHLHIGSLERIDDLVAYLRLLRPSGLGLLSLPVAGTGAEGDEFVDFNPELLAAGAVVSRMRDAPSLRLYGSLDNRALLAEAGEASTAAGDGPEGRVDGMTGGGARSAATDVPGGDWDPEAQVRAMAAAGFAGLKLWEGKPELHAALGISLDDPRLAAACRAAGEAGMPVILHVADPREFWRKSGGPWSYVGKHVASFEELQAQAESLAAAAPETTFIFAHMAFLADDLGAAAGLLSRRANVLLDLAPGNYFYPALAEAADRERPAHPERYQAAREFFLSHAHRLLAGSDGFFLPLDLGSLSGTSLSNNLERMLRLVRFLTTREPIASPYGLPDSPPLALGLGLPEETTRRILAGNFRDLAAAPARAATQARAATGPAASAGGPTSGAGPDPHAALVWLGTWCRNADGGRSPGREARAQAAGRIIEEAAE